jgi:hypothetical protein
MNMSASRIATIALAVAYLVLGFVLAIALPSLAFWLLS